MSPNGRIRFGTFELDAVTGELWSNGSKIRLAPKPARVLALLANTPGELVTRESIEQVLWEPGTFVDSEHGINFCIREIRAALGDSARQSQFVETLPRRGYRLVAKAAAKPARENTAASTEAQAIEAYEHYLRGRANLDRLDKGSLERAREDFERALALDPDYAMAHSGLGATHSMRTIYRRDPEDLNQAKTHLIRALELDPELAEPYPWLCYLNIRLSHLEEAIKTGHRAIELLPNLVQAHYFLGLAYFASAEQDASNYQPAIDHLIQATRIRLAWQASWFVLAYSALKNGDYVHAEEFSQRLLQLSGCGQGVPFIGAELVLASINLRERKTSEVRTLLADFRSRLDTSDHMYRHSMSAVAACLLGDAELRDNRPAEALIAYRNGHHLVQEHTRMLAHQRIDARAGSGMAAAYAALHEPQRALDLLDKSLSLTERSHASEHAAAGASLDELYWSLATAFLRLQDSDRALEMLERAICAGWRDASWLEKDPELETVREEPRYKALVKRVRQASKLRCPGSE